MYGLLREKGIKFYLPIIKAKIPLHNETVDKVEEFVHALLILRVRNFKKPKISLLILYTIPKVILSFSQDFYQNW